MNPPAQNLEICVHKTDGTFERFVQNEADLAKCILNEFQPGQIFDREKIIIADRSSLTSIPTRQVVRVDLVSEPPVHWTFPQGIVDAVELTGAEFQVLHQNPEIHDPRNQVRVLEDSVVRFLEVEMAGQQPLFLALELALEPSTNRPEAILHPLYPLAMPALCFRMRTGGVAALNPRHLVRFTLFPAPQLQPGAAWPAHRIKSQQRERSARQAGEALAGRPSPFHFPAVGQMNRDPSRRNQNENVSTMERKY